MRCNFCLNLSIFRVKTTGKAKLTFQTKITCMKGRQEHLSWKQWFIEQSNPFEMASMEFFCGSLNPNQWKTCFFLHFLSFGNGLMRDISACQRAASIVDDWCVFFIDLQIDAIVHLTRVTLVLRNILCFLYHEIYVIIIPQRNQNKMKCRLCYFLFHNRYSRIQHNTVDNEPFQVQFRCNYFSHNKIYKSDYQWNICSFFSGYCLSTATLNELEVLLLL